RFAPRAGLVTLRQTLVRRCHGGIGRPQNDGRKRSLPLHHSALSDCCERGRCAPAMFDVGVAPPHEEPRSGSSSSAHESTSGRSTNYGSGHLIRVFRDIGRIFSLLFLLSHPSPIGHLLRSSVQSRRRNMVSSEAKNGFNCVSCGTFQGARRGRASSAKREPRPSTVKWAGSREPSWCGRYEGLCYESSASQTHGRGEGSSLNVRHEQPIRHALLEMSDRCAVIRFLPPHQYFLRYSFLPIRPKCDCGHRFSFSPSLSLATPTSDLGPGHGTDSREKVLAKATMKLGLATTIAALWLTALPIASAVAQGAPGQISAARAAVRTDHDKTWYAWDYRWGRNIDCGAPLASMVAYECGAIA